MTWALSFTLIPFFGEDLEAVKGQRVVEVNIYYRYFFLSLCVYVIRSRSKTEKECEWISFWGAPLILHIIKYSTQM
jgi:hypothetical protein